MVTHVVMWRLKDRTPENADRVRAMLLEMKDRIPGMRELEVGVDYLRSERSYDLVLITRHDSREALEEYQVDPVHAQVKKVMLELREVSVAVDFEA